MAHMATNCVDHCGDGWRAIFRHDYQSHRGFALRRRKSAYKKSRVSHRRAHSSICVGLHDLRGSIARCGCVEIESAGARTFASRAGCAFILFLHKTIHLWSHIVLGFCLGISPAAAWIAIAGSLDPRMLILCAAVTFWVGGFDVLYACQDVDFDQRADLFSIPRRFGSRSFAGHCARNARRHDCLLAWLAFSFALPWPAWAGIAVVAAMLVWEHSLVCATTSPSECCVFHHKRLY